MKNAWTITAAALGMWILGGAAQARTLSLTGAGATFPYPLYSKWFYVYHQEHPKVEFNYQAIGSGAGQQQIISRTVDFGASDAPMTDEALAKAPGKLVHLPMTLGAVVVTYNVPGVPTGLHLTGSVVADIYLGKITTWNDRKIAELNPGVQLPSTLITVVHRSDGSGTTAVFTSYLCKVSPEWKEKVGTGTSVNWPVGLGGKGNQGVTGQVKEAPSAIGYVELAYSIENHLPYALLKNQAGVYVAPSIQAISAAAAGAAKDMPADFRVDITDAPGRASYPICSFTYLLVYANGSHREKDTALAHYIQWAIHEGQKYGPALEYAPLPAPVVQKVEAKLKTLTSGGKPLLK